MLAMKVSSLSLWSLLLLPEEDSDDGADFDVAADSDAAPDEDPSLPPSST